METLILVGVALLILGRRSQSSSQQVNPVSYTQSPAAYIGGALNMGGAIASPILSSAVNGISRPLTGAYSQPGAFVTSIADPSPIQVTVTGGSGGSIGGGFVGPDEYWQ